MIIPLHISTVPILVIVALTTLIVITIVITIVAIVARIINSIVYYIFSSQHLLARFTACFTHIMLVIIIFEIEAIFDGEVAEFIKKDCAMAVEIDGFEQVLDRRRRG